jgi:hypothetical protein
MEPKPDVVERAADEAAWDEAGVDRDVGAEPVTEV